MQTEVNKSRARVKRFKMCRILPAEGIIRHQEHTTRDGSLFLL